MKVDVVIPVYNEGHVLEAKIKELLAFLTDNCRDDWQIVIVDNASIDNTVDEMKKLSENIPHLKCFYLQQRGRGLALMHAWSNSQSDVVCYMDVDLSTDLKAFTQMMTAFKEGADIVIGSRLLKEAKIERCLLREFLSQSYNLMHRLLLNTHFSDAQCGFKGMTTKAAKLILPLTKNRKWFFDTELLLLAERLNFKLLEIPVTWIEDSDSRVNIRNAVIEDIKGLMRMRWMFWFDKRFSKRVLAKSLVFKSGMPASEKLNI